VESAEEDVNNGHREDGNEKTGDGKNHNLTPFYAETFSRDNEKTVHQPYQNSSN
jgi:hypothetical protein